MSNPGYEKFNKVRQEAYLELLREGVRWRLAARQAGVHPETIKRYRQRHPRFALEETSAELEAHEIVEDALFQAASSGNVPAAVFWLTNRVPDHWRDRRDVRQELSGPGGGPIVLDPGSHTRDLLNSPRAMSLTLEALDVLALETGVDDVSV